MSRQTLSNVIFAIILISLAAAASTVIPANNKVVSDLGYHTLCPFAPYSTLTLLFISGLGWIVRRYIDSQPSN